MKKLSGLAYVYIAILLIMLVIIPSSLTMPYFSSKLLPLIFSGVVLVLTAFALRQELTRPKAVPDRDPGSNEEESGAPFKGYLLHGAWLVGFVFGIFALGFLISMPIFVLFYMRWLGTRWITSIISAVATSGLVYLMFEVAFEIELHRGWLMSWLGF